MPALLDRARIAQLLPHQGRLCLLDRVIHWNAEHIACEADSHRAPDHPLRWKNQLGSAIGIEYAAQAMALHGALLAPPNDAPRQGMITRVQQVQCSLDRLDELPFALQIEAHRLMGDDLVVRYRFALRHQETCLLTGEASVLLGNTNPTEALFTC